ncbi:recombination regulator RecX [Halalkalibacillus sediminis]|uniref:Regulatory protein RecX n=1 Tax=Halalkalibacillus sediminis TaxID=2018042 RepID=A0A2I0QRK1_9BACI|nr:recombination regulator RecX [Halalkalibacillus sediminis]PKR76953.1 recombination regulator RecX [Halalkalibacillus sediminis]
MIISRITKQKKNQNRYNIFVKKNNEEAFASGVHEDILIRFALRKGMELNDEELQSIQQQDAIYKYYTLTLNFLSYRMRAKSEIITYLQDKEAEEEEIAHVLKKLEDEKLIDDEAFAEAYTRTKMNTSSKGPNVIRRELMEKKIPQNYIDEALAGYSKEIEVEKLTSLLEKKMSSNNRKSFNQQLNQAKQSMLQKGFNMDSIQLAIEEISIEKDEDEEMEAVRFQGEKAWRKHERKHEGFQLKQHVKASLFQKGFPGDLIQQFIEEKEEEEV